MIIQPKASTTSSLFVGDLVNISRFKGRDWKITLRIYEGGARFILTDESQEAKLIVNATVGIRELRSEDYAESLPGDHLRLTVADPVIALWGRTGQNKSVGPRVTFSCSIT